jgi:hypothetical protein
VNLPKNVGTLDRFLRALIAEALFILAFFWSKGIIRVTLFICTAILLISIITSFSLVYAVLALSTKIKPYEESIAPKRKILLIILIIFLIGCSIISYYYTRQQFLQQVDNLEASYKPLLLSTIQEKRKDSITNYEIFKEQFDFFYNSYSDYRPVVIRLDSEFTNDLTEIKLLIEHSRAKVIYGNITAAYLELDLIRPILNNMLRRNGLDNIKVQLVDLQEAIDLIADSAKKGDANEVISRYYLANEKLKDVEVKINTTEMQFVREHLNALQSLAKQKDIDKLPSKAAELKSSYLRVYLYYK